MGIRRWNTLRFINNPASEGFFSTKRSEHFELRPVVDSRPFTAAVQGFFLSLQITIQSIFFRDKLMRMGKST